MPQKLNSLILIFILLTLTSCSFELQDDFPSPTPQAIITATLPPTPTLRPSETPPPILPLQTLVPVEGITSTQLNVRESPSTTSTVIGIIAAREVVQITGKDIGGNWWQIVYETGLDGKGWVTAQFVEGGDNSHVPVIGEDASGTLTGNPAVVIQQLNIRSGPGTNFNSLGILNQDDVVILTGKNKNGSWVQIDFPDGPEGKGWVSSGFIKGDDLTSLPIVSDIGEVIGTGTPVNTPLPPTSTLIPAPMDFDTAASPLKTVILGGDGPYTVLYNGDVSFPEGDTEDWISVTPREDALFVAVECLGSDSIQIDIIGMMTDIVCNGNIQDISVSVDSPFLIHIQSISPANQLQYTKYILTIKARP